MHGIICFLNLPTYKDVQSLTWSRSPNGEMAQTFAQYSGRQKYFRAKGHTILRRKTELEKSHDYFQKWVFEFSWPNWKTLVAFSVKCKDSSMEIDCTFWFMKLEKSFHSAYTYIHAWTSQNYVPSSKDYFFRKMKVSNMWLMFRLADSSDKQWQSIVSLTIFSLSFLH